MNHLQALLQTETSAGTDAHTGQLICIRLFNVGSTTLKRGLSGYYQTSFQLLRDAFELVNLVDLFRIDPSAVSRWRLATDKELFVELRDAGGVHPLAQLVCFPAAEQKLDTTFTLVGFSKDFASSLRAKGKPVPKEFLDAEKGSEKDRFILQWPFHNGVEMQREPELLQAVVGSKGHMWSAEDSTKLKPKRLTLRMVFSATGRYSRDVLLDDVLATSVPGRCEPIN